MARLAPTSGRTVVGRYHRLCRSVWRAVKKPQFQFGVVVLVPLLAWYLAFSVGPIVRAFWMAFVDYNLLEPAKSVFVGLRNFRGVFRNDLFWTSARHTLTYAAVLYITLLPLSLVFSLSLTSIVRGRAFFQFVLFLPVVVSVVAVALLFSVLMSLQTGPLNQMLRLLGLPPCRFLEGHESALYSVAGIDVWKSLGFYIVILTAGLLNIPEEMYDAAKVDGAGRWRRFWHITLPLLGHTIALVCVLLAMQGLQAFTLVVVLPDRPGGPGTATYVMNLLVYNEAFANLRFGLATAAAFTLFVAVLVVTVVQLKLVRPTWHY